ncbi:MAG: M14 family metallopeptidase [Pyrinomonadaceae bacterium]
MSRHVIVAFLLVAPLFFHPAPATAQRVSRVSRRASPPTPYAVLGFTPGADRRVADWKQITDYFARLDRTSDRVLVQTLGETTLKRPLVVAFVSAPENIRDLAKYKEAARRLADPRLVASEAERDRLLREGRAVVVISCSIHSTEIVASQMSMQLAYELAAAEDAETREILRETILLLVPAANPDGVDMVADWYRRTLDTPHEGINPPELYHHYAGHDNNRDWFMLNLRETQLLSRLFWREWFPQIVYDVHQQGAASSRFFVPPFYDPPNPHIAPALLREVGLIGHKMAADLQAAGHRGVLTNALYDTWWHGGFRTAPYYHNSIGILSEAASARLMSPIDISAKELSEASSRGMPSALQSATNFPDPWPGGTWRPRDILKMEMIAARSVLSMAAKYRARYLRNFYELGRRGLDWQPGPRQPAAYLIPLAEGKREAIAKMLGALIEQGVEVHRVGKTLRAAIGAEQQTQELRAGDYLIFLAQPYRANVQALFERQTYPERRAADNKAERPYDVAGWTMPLQMGIDTIALLEIKDLVGETSLRLVREASEIRRSLNLEAKPRAPQGTHLSTNKVGLYRGWTNSMDEGWTRLVFDDFNVPYQTLRDRDLRAGALRARFDVIILPSQNDREIFEGRAPDSYPAEFTGGIGENGVTSLRAFVEQGGTLVCFDAATELAIKRFNLPVRNALEGVSSADFYCPARFCVWP